jgi:hypothetical protein
VLNSYKKFSKAANATLLFAGGLLLLMQLHSFQHTQYPDDFPLNTDDHHHAHEAMKKEVSPLADYPKRLNLDSEPSSVAPKPERHSHDDEEEPHSH